MGLSIGFVGLGAFGSGFADLFMKHPQVSRIGLCDRLPERVKTFAEREDWQAKLNPADTFTNIDDLLAGNWDAVAIFTQPWLHAPQAAAAMQAGKHVYSAVPVIWHPDGNQTLDWCDRLVRLSEKTGLNYMLGETTVFRAQTMYCRRKAAENAFGDFVYAEGEYMHDVDALRSLREVKRNRMMGPAASEYEALMRPYLAKDFKSGPMQYPTHSVSGPLSVMKTHALKVTAYGFKNRNGDPYFTDSAFSNETALFQMANGSTLRIAECREAAGDLGSGDETFRIVGTKGTFVPDTWMHNGRTTPENGGPTQSEALTTEQMRDPLPAQVVEAWTDVSTETVAYGGHGGSHAYLVHEFIDALVNGRSPIINAWQAARYMAMGITAHKSALLDGERLDVPDWGDGPQVVSPGSQAKGNL